MQDACESVEKENSLFRINGLELDCLISVLPPARRAPAVEVLLDVVPAELAYLRCSVVSRGTPESQEQRRLTW